MEWLLHWNTGSIRKHKPSVLCSVLLSNNSVIVKAFSKNISSRTNVAYSEKVNLQVPIRLSFQGLPSFLAKEKLAKSTYFATGHYFIHPPLNFCYSEFNYISTTLSFSLVCLAKVCKHSVKYLLLILRVILQKLSAKTLILSSLRR